MKQKNDGYHGITRGWGGRFIIILPVTVGKYRQFRIQTELKQSYELDDAAKFFDIALKCLLPFTLPGTEPNFPDDFESISEPEWLAEPATFEGPEDYFRVCLSEAKEKLQKWAEESGARVDDLESERRRETDNATEKLLVEKLTRAKNISKLCRQSADKVDGLRIWLEKVAGNPFSDNVLKLLGVSSERESLRKASEAHLQAANLLSQRIEAAIQKYKDDSPKLAKENPLL